MADADLTRDDIGPGARMPGAAEAAHAEILDRLTQRLSRAGLRLQNVRARLHQPEDRLDLVQAGEDLDEAIAEMRRLALAWRLAREGR